MMIHSSAWLADEFRWSSSSFVKGSQFALRLPKLRDGLGRSAGLDVEPKTIDKHISEPSSQPPTRRSSPRRFADIELLLQQVSLYLSTFLLSIASRDRMLSSLQFLLGLPLAAVTVVIEMLLARCPHHSDRFFALRDLDFSDAAPASAAGCCSAYASPIALLASCRVSLESAKKRYWSSKITSDYI